MDVEVDQEMQHPKREVCGTRKPGTAYRMRAGMMKKNTTGVRVQAGSPAPVRSITGRVAGGPGGES